MRSFKLECYKRAQSNLGSDLYIVMFSKPLTVREFIDEVLAYSKEHCEWGDICINLNAKDWFDYICTLTYSYGEINNDEPNTFTDEYLNKKIRFAKADGSWNNFDFHLVVEEDSND